MEQRSVSILAPAPEGPPSAARLRSAAAIAAAGYLALVVVMLGIGFTLIHPLDASVGGWDTAVNRWFAEHRTDTWNSITSVATWFVNTVPAIAIAAVITAVLAVRRRWREAAMLVLALALELAVFLSVTFVIARPRPDVVRLNATPSTSSFPSGHTAAATVLFAGLAIIVTCCTRNTTIRVLMILLAVAGATVVGFGRVYRGMHHPTDVFAGVLLGGACLLVSVLAVRAVPRRPEAAPRTSDETEWQAVRMPAA